MSQTQTAIFRGCKRFYTLLEPKAAENTIKFFEEKINRIVDKYAIKDEQSINQFFDLLVFPYSKGRFPTKEELSPYPRGIREAVRECLRDVEHLPIWQLIVAKKYVPEMKDKVGGVAREEKKWSMDEHSVYLYTKHEREISWYKGLSGFLAFISFVFTCVWLVKKFSWDEEMAFLVVLVSGIVLYIFAKSFYDKNTKKELDKLHETFKSEKKR
jgi:hypothetical protein